jgi:hypothetical protein
MMQGILTGRPPGLARKSLTALPLRLYLQGIPANRGSHRSMETFAARDGVQDTIHCQIKTALVSERAMTFTIHAWKADQNITTVRIGPAVAVDKARELEKTGWQVYVTDAAGSRFPLANFDRLLSITSETA